MPVPYDFFDYPAYWKGRTYENESEKLALHAFLKIIGKKESVVEVGAGYGRLFPFYNSFFQKITLIEPSEKLLKLAKESFGMREKKMEFLNASLPQLPVKDNSFDVVLMVRVIHHFSDSKKVIKELSRILKPGGFLILEIANKVHFLARAKQLVKGNLSFISDLSPFEQRSAKSISEKKILFLNHHPKAILNNLEENNLKVEKILSVSNLRCPIVKKIVPLTVLLLIERITQGFLSKLFFGPSIFVLAVKSHNT